MRRAIYISIAFHAAVIALFFITITFSQVTYVPRQVYDVTLVSASIAQAAAPKVEVKTEPEPVAPEPEPVKEEEKEEEMPAPPEKPKKKTPEPKKTETKTVPSTEVTKTDAPPGTAETGTGTAETPTATGEMSFEGDFPFASYISRMRTKIAASWRVPAGSEGTERAARVYFRVHRDGSVSHVAVEESSGLLLFDQSCQRSVLQSAPMPPLPREYADEYLGVHFGFVYRPSQ